MKKLTLAATLIATIVAANYVTTRYGIVFGIAAGTVFAGAALLVRDLLQEAAGYRATLAVIGLGGVVSFFLASPAIAIASAVAFILSESIDLAVYSTLRPTGRIRAVAVSNVAGAIVDSAVFLTIAGFGLAFLPGQVLGKLAVTLPVIAALYVRRNRAAVTA